MKTDSSSLDYRGVVASTYTAEIYRCLLLIALGFLLPAAVHLVPSSVPLGPILMPLLLPVALAAYVLPLRSALAVAVILPFSSMLATGMPPFPIACEMVAEGVALITMVNIFSSKRRHWLASYLAGILASRVVSLIYVVAFTGSDATTSALAASKGLVGFGLIALVLPLLFNVFSNSRNR